MGWCTYRFPSLANLRANSKPIEIEGLLSQANKDASTKSRWRLGSREGLD